jgi:hypothetical protein
MMEAVRTSETSIDNHFTRQYNPEDNSEHYTRRRENLKSHKEWPVHSPYFSSLAFIYDERSKIKRVRIIFILSEKLRKILGGEFSLYQDKCFAVCLEIFYLCEACTEAGRLSET